MRFTSCNLLSSALSLYIGATTSQAPGSLVGVTTVYCTMPFDDFKTQMQSIASRNTLKGFLDGSIKFQACITAGLTSGGGLTSHRGGYLPNPTTYMLIVLLSLVHDMTCTTQYRTITIVHPTQSQFARDME